MSKADDLLAAFPEEEAPSKADELLSAFTPRDPGEDPLETGNAPKPDMDEATATPEEQAAAEYRQRYARALQALANVQKAQQEGVEVNKVDGHLQVTPRERGVVPAAKSALAGAAMNVLPSVAGIAAGAAGLATGPAAIVASPAAAVLAGGATAAAQNALLTRFMPETAKAMQELTGEYPGSAALGGEAVGLAGFRPGASTALLPRVAAKMATSAGRASLSAQEALVASHIAIGAGANAGVAYGTQYALAKAGLADPPTIMGALASGAQNLILTEPGPLGRLGFKAGGKVAEVVSKTARENARLGEMLKQADLDKMRMEETDLTTLGGHARVEAQTKSPEVLAAEAETTKPPSDAEPPGPRRPPTPAENEAIKAVEAQGRTEDKPPVVEDIRRTPKFQEAQAAVKKAGAKSLEEATALLMKANPELHPAASVVMARQMGYVSKETGTLGDEINRRTDTLVKTWNWRSTPRKMTDAEYSVYEFQRENLAQKDRDTDIAETAVRKFSGALSSLTPEQKRDFTYAAETGRTDELPPALRKAAETFNRVHEAGWKSLEAHGKPTEYIEDYVPHLFKQPDKAAEIMGGAGKGAGSNFLKERSRGPTYREAFNDYGLAPVTEEPIENAMLGVRQREKYLATVRLRDYLKNQGFTKVVEADGKAPAGYVVKEGRMWSAGGPGRKLAVPAEIAAVIDQTTGPGLNQHPWFEQWRSVANAMTGLQLGLSAFHAGFIINDVMSTHLAVALQNAAKGNLKDAIVGAALAPLSPLKLLHPNVRKINREWNHPGFYSPDSFAARTVGELTMAGGEAKRNRVYSTGYATGIQEALDSPRWRDNAKLLWRVPLAMVESASAPVMEHLVPAAKVLAFSHMMDFERQNLPDGFARMTSREQRVVYRKRAQEIWDNVDNRMGQVRWENYMWPSIVKQGMFMGMRAAGWNVGSWRVMAGGASDLATLGKTKGKAQLTPAAAYFLAYHIQHAVQSALLTSWMTGKKLSQIEPEDLVAADTGKKDKFGRAVRVIPPDYLRDENAFRHHIESEGGWKSPTAYPRAVWDMVKGKANPAITAAQSALSNTDWRGNEIMNIDDPLIRPLRDEMDFWDKTLHGMTPTGPQSQASQIASAMGKQVLPFSITNVGKANQLGLGDREKALGFVGYGLEGSYARLSPDEQAIQRYYQKTMPHNLTPEQQAAQGGRKDFRRGLEEVSSKGGDVGGYLVEALRTGRVTERAAREQFKKLGTDPRLEMFKRIDPTAQQVVIERTADPDRKVEYQQIAQEQLDKRKYAELSLKGSRRTDEEQVEFSRLKEQFRGDSRQKRRDWKARSREFRDLLEAR